MRIPRQQLKKITEEELEGLLQEGWRKEVLKLFGGPGDDAVRAAAARTAKYAPRTVPSGVSHPISMPGMDEIADVLNININDLITRKLQPAARIGTQAGDKIDLIGDPIVVNSNQGIPRPIQIVQAPGRDPIAFYGSSGSPGGESRQGRYLPFGGVTGYGPSKDFPYGHNYWYNKLPVTHRQAIAPKFPHPESLYSQTGTALENYFANNPQVLENAINYSDLFNAEAIRRGQNPDLLNPHAIYQAQATAINRHLGRGGALRPDWLHQTEAGPYISPYLYPEGHPRYGGMLYTGRSPKEANWRNILPPEYARTISKSPHEDWAGLLSDYWQDIIKWNK